MTTDQNIIKLNIDFIKVDPKKEKQIISIIDSVCPEHKYIKLPDDIINEIENKTKHLLNIDTVLGIRRAYLKDRVIKNHHYLVQNIKKIYSEYKKNKNIIYLSNKYNQPPLNIFRQFLNYKNINKEKIKKILNNPYKYIGQKDAQQVEIAKEQDIVSNIDQKASAELAEQFEKKIQEMLENNSIKFKTQEDLTKEQIQKYGKAINTPDFLILSDLQINGNPINWIDAKNFYGLDSKLNLKRFENQTRKYVEKWGQGLLYFKLGHTSTLNIFRGCD